MGKVKLTLSVENQVIVMAKKIANEKKLSLSKIIEHFLLNDFLKHETKSKVSLSDKLSGIAKANYGEMTDKEIKAMILKEKHGI